VATRSDLQEWIVEALERLGGEASVVQVCRDVWRWHEDELHDSGDLFFTWQYDIRWAAQKLRDRGVLLADAETPRGVWQLPPRD
jgi:hypothetical protein